MSIDNIQKITEAFRAGRTVVFPTDTAYGIGCRMDNLSSVREVFQIKKRDLNNPLLVLVDSIEMAEKYVKFDSRSLRFVKKYWPGGLTVFLPCYLDKVPGIVRAGTSTLAIRWPKHKAIEKIISNICVPLIATSANISGKETPYTLDQVDKVILDQVDLIMEGECTYKKESTIIDCSVSPWKIVRQGAVKIGDSV